MVTIPTSPTSPSGTFGSYKIAPPPKKPASPYLVFFAVIALIAAAGYYFFIYQGVDLFSEMQALPPAPPLTSLEIKVSQLSGFSFGAIESPFYKSLTTFGSLPVVADSLGRKNPFVPY